MQWRDAVSSLRRTEPVLRTAALVGAAAYVLFVVFFAAVTHWNIAAAMYYVVTTMEGSPDTLLCSDCGGTLVGFAGLQQFDSFALLRSVVVFPGARTQANGTRIVNWLAAEADQRGANELFLLTTTAADFFEKRGFRPVDRNEAPAAIASTAEFTSLCPASAVFMRRACVTRETPFTNL